MLYVVLLAVSFLAVGNAFNQTEIIEFAESCFTVEKASKEELQKIFQSKGTSTADENVKCYAACVAEKAGLLVNGKFSREASLEFVKDHSQMLRIDDDAIHKRIAKAISACEKDVGENNERCELGYKLLQCIFRYEKEVFPTSM